MPGPKGVVRNPVMVLVLSVVTCGIYGLWWWYTILTELRNFTQDEDINPTINLVLLLLLGCIWQFVLPFKMGKWILKARQIAGLPEEEDKSTTWLILSLLCLGIVVVYLIQTELNRIWESGGAPAIYQPPMPGTGM